jgi:hypothetical protein
MLPFTHEQFIAVFAAYNAAVWPAPVAAYGLAAVGLAAVWLRLRWSGALMAIVLALLWAWTGIAYHLMHFAVINPAARLFGGLFVVQALLLLAWSWRQAPQLRFGGQAGRLVGSVLLFYALVAYPLLGLLFGYGYPGMPTFGITPCPLTLFTFGALLLASSRPPWWLIAIPLGWSLVGGSAAVLLHVPQDWVLLLGGPVASVFCLPRPAHRHPLGS